MGPSGQSDVVALSHRSSASSLEGVACRFGSQGRKDACVADPPSLGYRISRLADRFTGPQAAIVHPLGEDKHAYPSATRIRRKHSQSGS